MFRLAHISDVHLTPLPPVSWIQLASKRITGYLNWKLNRERAITNDYFDTLLAHLEDAQPDHIAITGDLVNLSLPLEILRARDFLERMGTGETVSAICGNHDAYVPGALKRSLKAWETYVSSDDAKTTKIRDFPYLRVRGDVAIIGCNSAEATAPFMATGYFRRAQAKKLSQLLEQTKGMCRIVMIHHPPIEHATPGHKKLHGIARFQKVIAQQGAELILHGHTHLATHNEISGPKNKVPVICVPAAGNSTGNLKPPGRFNLFDIERFNNGWRIHWTAKGVAAVNHEFETLSEETFVTS